MTILTFLLVLRMIELGMLCVAFMLLLDLPQSRHRAKRLVLIWSLVVINIAAILAGSFWP